MRIVLFLLSMLSCAAPAIGEGWPTDVTSYEVSGIKLGDTPDDALAVLRLKGFDCLYRNLLGNDGRLKDYGYSGRIECSSEPEIVNKYWNLSESKTRIELTIAATDFDNLGDPDKHFVQRIHFIEAYKDPPNTSSMHAALKEKYGDITSVDVNRDGDAQARAAWQEKQEACRSIYKQNAYGQNKWDKESLLELNACKIEQKRLESDFYLTLPSSVNYSYTFDSTGSTADVEIVAEWQGLKMAADADRDMRQLISERDAIEGQFKIEKPKGTTF